MTLRDPDDWGERSRRWAAVTSEVVEIGGVPLHYLSAGPAGRDPGAGTHLLIHPMSTGSWSWMDVLPPLAAGGRVLAPDLPGAGRTRPTDPRTSRVEHGADVLQTLVEVLDLDRVVLHGHSLGGLVGALFAARHPERVSHLILTSPALPGGPDPPRFPRLWRPALAVAPALARGPMRLALGLKIGAMRRWREDPADPDLAAAVFRGGADVTRISPELLTLIAEEVERLRTPWRIDGTLQAATSAVAAMTVDEAAVRAELDRIRAPTLVLWGERDRALPRAVVDDLRRSRPTWTILDVPDVGHLLPWEAPATYVELVRTWLGPHA